MKVQIRRDKMRHVLPSPPAIGGKWAKTLYHCPEVHHQDEPTDGHPISAHKQMAGHDYPQPIKHYEK